MDLGHGKIWYNIQSTFIYDQIDRLVHSDWYVWCTYLLDDFIASVSWLVRYCTPFLCAQLIESCNYLKVILQRQTATANHSCLCYVQTFYIYGTTIKAISRKSKGEINGVLYDANSKNSCVHLNPSSKTLSTLYSKYWMFLYKPNKL